MAERIDLLLDPGTFEELDQLVLHRSKAFGLDEQQYLGDAVVTGHGLIDGRVVFIFAQDFTTLGGTLSEAMGEKIGKLYSLAMNTGNPIVGLYDSGGARVPEGIDSFGAFGDVLFRASQASGMIPQISVILGACVGRATYAPALSDFVFMTTETARMFVTGPEAIESITGEVIESDDLGGAMSHAINSGVCHFAIDTEQDTLAEVRRLLSFLPPNARDDAPIVEADNPSRRCERLWEIVPAEGGKSYDVRDVIVEIADAHDLMEVHGAYAQNMVVGFARLNGRTTGVVANQPAHLAGSIDIDSSRKAARFVRFCDAFSIPILTFVDTSGFLPGVQQEYAGIITHGAKLVYAYAEATVPKVTVILRKAFGGAYDAMGSKHLRTDINFSWPQGEVAVVGPEPAVNILFRNEIAAAADPAAERARIVADYAERFANPYVAAARGYVDDVIDPAETRSLVVQAFAMLASKADTMPHKKHGNIPL